MDHNKVKDAVDTLSAALMTDPDLFEAYKSNIAVSFMDTAMQKMHIAPARMQIMHEVANLAAQRFLNVLCEDRTNVDNSGRLPTGKMFEENPGDWWIETVTGKRYYPLSPREDQIDIEDIAHALSNICRFTGHTRRFYSVAQHSVLMSYVVPPDQALAALLHDASEAYLNDVSLPVKRLMSSTVYNRMEFEAELLISLKYGFTFPFDPSIKEADGRMLFTEKRDLMPASDWGYELEPYPFTINTQSPKQAYHFFMSRFHSLYTLKQP